MAVFKSKKGKQVLVKGVIVEFKADEFETDDKDVIAALSKAKDVSASKPASKAAHKSDK